MFPWQWRTLELDSAALAKRIVEIAEDKQASDIVMLDIRRLSTIADYFVVCSAGSERQISAVNKEIVETLAKEERLKPRQTEGVPSSGWVLLDYGDVIVHIFNPVQRRYYQLEDLWSAALPVVRIQ